VAQQLALGIAAPLSLMVLVLAAAALVFLRVGLRGVTLSLRSLAGETERIAAGDLDHSLPVLGVDEVGQLTGSFEQMRASLRARLDELNRLLAVSQGVASSLDLAEAIRPVLDAALATGASAARMVVVPATGLGYEPEGPSRFGAGAAHEAYAHMDDAVMGLARRQDRVALSTLHRVRGLELDPLAPQPASLIAVALRHESRFYGVLWAAYDKARAFAETDVSYLSTLAGQAALAAANAHLFLSAEVGRERLAAILSSTPDPVLVTDSKNRLLFANPAAWQALGAAVGTGEGQPVEGMISEKPLLDLLLAVREDNSSVEVELPGGRVYLATASPVAAEGRLVGRVCILRDVTYFKELDAMKSEFVSTVSHDLRSPLTLMRGYATMLEMVGELNEQQQSYTGKIIVGVENMARLINNLLDLGRIEVGVGLRIEAVDVAEVVDGVIGALQPQAAGKNIEIEVDLPAGKAPALEADAGLFQQAIFNLVDNAIKYTAPGGKVSLRLTVKPDLMGLEVKDNGIGVPTADLPRLFEKFYRGSQREARQERGSGLGLAIVRSIVEKHGGRVWVESRPGRGSRFFVEMPWKQPDRG
jgi:signal transduction histidine kinase/HAMP domain-containing protein